MRVAALYDVHGNLPALEAVLADRDSPAADLIVSGGDLVAGPMPSASLELLTATARSVLFVRGNADRTSSSTARRTAGAWCADELGPERLAAVAAWPNDDRARLRGGATFCHATPRLDDEILTRMTPDDDRRGGAADAPTRLRRVRAHPRPVRPSRRRHRLVERRQRRQAVRGRQGAFWLLRDDVELLDTDYDIQARRSDPGYRIRRCRRHAAPARTARPDEASAYFESLRGA